MTRFPSPMATTWDIRRTRRDFAIVVAAVAVVVLGEIKLSFLDHLLTRAWTKHGDLTQEALEISSIVAVGLAAFAMSCLRGLVRENRERVAAVQHYQTLFDRANDAILIFDPGDGTILAGNARAGELYGLTQHALVGRNLREFSNDFTRAAEAIATVLSPTDGQSLDAFEFTQRRADGGIIHVLARASAIEYQGRPAILTINRDITERKKADEELRHRASHDPLTDLPNRTVFMERLAEALRRDRRDTGPRFATFFLDLDRFKHVNDSLGHMDGDNVLAAVGHRLRSCLPDRATICRLGGDEFVILLEGVTDAAQAGQVAERIYEVLELPFAMHGQEVFVSASIGIVVESGDSARAEDVLRDADAAMYRAKALGSGRYVVFDPTMRTDSATFLHREIELRRAVEREEFEAAYQPIVTLATGAIIGFEGLVRWRHPLRGLVSPAEFVPLAEETGLIVAIDRWMMREACRQMCRWDEEFPNLPPMGLGMNVSAHFLAQPDFVAHVEGALTETGVDPARLRLEITESTLIAHTAVAAAALGRLRALGVRIVLDDFGVGYSSLNYLRQFPIDTVKIDRSFINHAESDAIGAALVEGIVTLVHSMGMRVVAEGIEDATQLARLRAATCDSGQGYLFSPPLSTEDAARLLAARALCPYTAEPYARLRVERRA